MQKFELGAGSAQIYQGFMTLPGQATRQAGQAEDSLADLARREHDGFNARWTLVMARMRDGAAGPAR
jgi:hypothetical protein